MLNSTHIHSYTYRDLAQLINCMQNNNIHVTHRLTICSPETNLASIEHLIAMVSAITQNTYSIIYATSGEAIGLLIFQSGNNFIWINKHKNSSRIFSKKYLENKTIHEYALNITNYFIKEKISTTLAASVNAPSKYRIPTSFMEAKITEVKSRKATLAREYAALHKELAKIMTDIEILETQRDATTDVDIHKLVVDTDVVHNLHVVDNLLIWNIPSRPPILISNDPDRLQKYKKKDGSNLCMLPALTVVLDLSFLGASTDISSSFRIYSHKQYIEETNTCLPHLIYYKGEYSTLKNSGCLGTALVQALREAYKEANIAYAVDLITSFAGSANIDDSAGRTVTYFTKDAHTPLVIATPSPLKEKLLPKPKKIPKKDKDAIISLISELNV